MRKRRATEWAAPSGDFFFFLRNNMNLSKVSGLLQASLSFVLILSTAETTTIL
jgi:hypothetical protein